MGPQAWPNLLFDVLKGRVAPETLRQRCEEAGRANKQTALLKDALWACHECRGQFSWHRYFARQLDVDANPEWQINFSKYILQPGFLRQCRDCRGEQSSILFACHGCLEKKTRAHYSHSYWEHRHDRDGRKTYCLVCAARMTEEQCSITFPCQICGVPKTRAHYADTDWHHRDTNDGRKTSCLACAAHDPEFTCTVCGITKPQDGFTQGMWHHKNDPSRRTLCLTCCNPRCIALHCKTCPHCRNPEHPKRRKCKDDVRALNPKQLPTDFDAVKRYLCTKCRYITCIGKSSKGLICGKEMPRRRQQRLGASHSEPYKCGECLTEEYSRATQLENKMLPS